MKRILILTHAGLASGFLETLEFIGGQYTDIDIVCAYTETTDPEKVFLDKLETYIGDKIIVLTDIMYGSVNQFCCRNLIHGYFLITGINLPLIMELAVCREDQITEDYLLEIIEKARQQLQLVKLKELQAKPEKMEDFF